MKTKLIVDPLTGNPIPTADTAEIESRVTALENEYVRSTRFESIGAGTSGTVTLPTNATVILDDFGGTVDAIVSGITGGKPNFEPVYDSNSIVVAATFDTNGAYTLSSAPSSYPVALIYRVRQKLVDFDDTDASIIGQSEIEPLHAELSDVRGGIGANAYHLVQFETKAACKAAAPTVDGTLAYVSETQMLYVYCDSCDYPADDDLFLVTGNGGATRWEALQKLSRAQGDTGWINYDNAQLTKLSSTQVRFAISSPAAIGIKGVPIVVPVGNYDCTISGAPGIKFIGFNDNTLTLTHQDTLWDFDTQCPVAIAYWTGTAITAQPQTEFHGIRDTIWHAYTHQFVGLQYKSGLTFTGSVQADSVNNPGADDTVFYLWSTSGVVQDEDFVSTPGIGQWAQTLGSGLTSATAGIFPFFYFDGTAITAVDAMADRSPFIHAGANTTPQWNNGGTLTAGVTGDYIVYHYFVTPMVGGWSVFGRPHNAVFTSLAAARLARPSQLTWTNYAELKHLHTAIFRVNTNWSNTHRCKLVSLEDFRTVSGGPIASTSATDHNALSNRGAIFSHPIGAIYGVESGTIPFHTTSANGLIEDSRLKFNSGSGKLEANIDLGSFGSTINGATEKTTPVDADMLGLMDSAASNVLKKLSWSNVKATLKAYFDTIYSVKLSTVLFEAKTISAVTTGWTASTSSLSNLPSGKWIICLTMECSSTTSLTNISGALATNGTSDGTGILQNGKAGAGPSEGVKVSIPNYLYTSNGTNTFYFKALSVGANVAVGISGFAMKYSD